MGSMRLSWGQWGSVEIVRGPMGVSGDPWCSMGVFGAHSGSVGLSAQCLYTLKERQVKKDIFKQIKVAFYV